MRAAFPGRPTGMKILFLLRSGAADDLQSLLEALGIEYSEYPTLRAVVERQVRLLADVGLVQLTSDRDRKIKISESWGQIQTALGISLTELATYRPHESMVVDPFFGKPRKLDPEQRSDVFVLMPFSKELAPVYEDHIKNTVNSLNLSVKRADDFFAADSIMADIWAAICGARIIIADCTDRNPNVFYEIGLAHTIGKPVILITQKSEDIPFDIRHIRYIQYQLTPRGMSAFETKLKATISEIAKGFDY